MPNPDQDKWLAKIGVTSALKRAKSQPAGAPQRITFSEDEVAPITVSRVATKTTAPQVIAFSEDEVSPIVATRPATATAAKTVKSPAAEGESDAEKSETESGFGGEFLKDLTKTGAEQLAGKGLEAIAEAAKKATGELAAGVGEVAEGAHEALEGVGKIASVVGAAKEGWDIGTGVDKVMEGKTAEGATKIVAGGAGLGVKISEVAAAAGTAGAGAAAAAGVAAGGSILLAKETAEAAIKGEETPIDVADKFYGTHFGDIAGWVKGEYSKDKKKE